ncbi:methylcytosine dioxygenase TET3 isoform X1 [Anoplopoma fimbria]|uniref:methylcytosine dioxygenase TET3 isoform X1 n=2 Tax=Anoplopoma fimbria TaxID=229290 RepID=UPI0023EBB352|nr:methylcytosine dioxygenase TET3 isoform X1 [Anoplopoma fimbria]
MRNTVREVTSVDGPRSGGQMEIGSHDRLQEGSLSLELANGVNRYPNDDSTSSETEQQRAGSVPPRQSWLSGHGKVSDNQQQQPCWNSNSGTTPGEPVHHADMEDARNLVAFSAIAGSLPPSSSSFCMQPNTSQLYEKFTKEMGVDGAQAKLSAGAPEGSCQTPEDLNTLQSALSQAKHGHKPPNCNCDGPDCPDYLEWLEKKIKLATNEDQGACKMADVPPHLKRHLPQTHLQHPRQPYTQMNGGHRLSASYPQQQQGSQGPNIDQVHCLKPPIPCSPQVLSIAKENNISLQTAIAIEALTQLSGTGPQAAGSPGQLPYHSNLHHHQHIQNLPSQPPNGTSLIPSSPGTNSSSSRSQSVPPGLNTIQQASVSFEHHRPQSQGQPPHATPLPSSTSPFPGQGKHPGFSPNPQQWQQGSGRGSEQRNPWMCIKSEPQSHYAAAPHSSSDPMSELKQLLGDTSSKFRNAHFKLPVKQQIGLNQNGGIQAQDNPALARIKQEPDSGENYHHTASMGHYCMSNGQQQGQHYPGPPLSPGQAAISHSTQAALQQHLHYKRNLFSNHSPGFGALGPRAPMACQNLKKWWPQMDAEGLPHPPIKQEPKKRKSSQGSPVIKGMSGMLAVSPLPKPKQIIIKKTKQKASMPTFLPQSQISVQKPSVLMVDRALALNSLQPGSLPSLPLHSNSTQAAAAGLPAPAQSQVSIYNSSMTPSSTVSALSENTPALMGPLLPPVAPEADAKSEGVGSLASRNTSTTTPVTSTFPSSTSQLQSVINIDPKYEELIRQFEAEFGDSAPDASTGHPMEETATAPQPRNQSQTSPQDFTPTSTSTSQSAPLILATQASYTPHPDDQKMEVSKDESGTQSEATLNQASTESSMRDVSLHQQAFLQKQRQPSVLEDTFNIPCSPLPKRMKIEASGDIAVLSTTCYSEEDTPTKDSLPSSPSLRGFLESPLRYLDTPTKTLLSTPSKDLQAEFPTCTCVEQILEKDEGPYYNHLGSGPTVASIRDLMETRYGEKGNAIRIEKVVYTGKEGKSSRGCPIAKWVIRRSNETEKLLCLVRHRAGHHCANAHIIILIMAWEGVPRALADKLYHELSGTLTQYGNPTSRRCGLNDDRTCACQGKDSETCGASFSFGCSWSMYFNGCKYARSKIPRKFRLQGDHPEEEDKLRDNFQHLATEVAPIYKQLAPQAYSNQCQTESKAPDCRLGLKEGRPFSGVTACMDFCAHAHKDQHNLYNGCTVVCTLTKEDNRSVKEIPEDEQLHVLPLYRISKTDEFGSEEAQRLKMQTNAIHVLQAFRREVRKLPEPAKSCRQRRLEAKKANSEKKKNKLMQQAGETPEKTEIKAEVCITGSAQPQGNKAIIKQEVKPIIKKEPFNGSIHGYPVHAADPYNNIYPHPAYYARGGLPPTGQPSASDPVNGYHHNLPPMHYGYYNYPPNALFPPKLRTYEGRNGALPKAGGKAVQVDVKPDIQSLQARLAQSFPSHPEQANHPNHSAYTQHADHNQSRPSSVCSETSNRGTPVIKQEPMDVPVYEGTMQSQAGANTPSNTPQPAAWHGHKLNGSIVPTNWEGHLNPKPSPEASLLNPDKQQFHQHPQQRQPSPYPQQWTSYPGSNALMISPAQSPSLQVPPSPSPSPHLGTVFPGNMHQGSTRPSTPRPSTPQTGTPQPGGSHSGSVTPQPGTPGPGTPRHWASPAPSPQPNAWGMGPAYSPGLKHSNPAGAYPDKIWSKTGESRCTTPLGLQEKAWKSCGGSMAGISPSPAPEGRLFPDALQQSDQACWTPGRAESDTESTRSRRDDDDEVWSDSEHNFLDPNIGGVAVAPAHGSILIECARRELHATTPLRKPDRSHPTRISLVFYQHKNLNQPVHGLAIWEAKMKLLAERALQRQQEAALLGLSQEDIKALGKKRKWGATVAGASPGPGQSIDKREGPVTRLAPTFHTSSMVTVSPYAFTRLTGPYSHFV